MHHPRTGWRTTGRRRGRTATAGSPRAAAGWARAPGDLDLADDRELVRGPADNDVALHVEAAVQLLQQHALEQDPTMRGLVDLFRHDSNRVRAQEVWLNVTSEASRELKAVASLKIPVTLAISASFSDLKTQVQELIVELTVTF